MHFRFRGALGFWGSSSIFWGSLSFGAHFQEKKLGRIFEMRSFGRIEVFGAHFRFIFLGAHFRFIFFGGARFYFYFFWGAFSKKHILGRIFECAHLGRIWGFGAPHLYFGAHWFLGRIFEKNFFGAHFFRMRSFGRIGVLGLLIYILGRMGFWGSSVLPQYYTTVLRIKKKPDLLKTAHFLIWPRT